MPKSIRCQMRNEKAKDVRFFPYCTRAIGKFSDEYCSCCRRDKCSDVNFDITLQNQFNSVRPRFPDTDCFADSDASSESSSWPNFFMTYAKYSKTPLSRSGSVSTLRSQSSRASSGFMKCGCREVMYRKVPPGTNTRSTSRRYRSMFSRTSSGGSHTEPWNL